MVELVAQLCIDAGKCTVLSNNQYYASIGAFVGFGLMLVFMFFLIFWTPALTFLKAKMSKNPLIYMVNRSQRGKFCVADVKDEGVGDVKGVGTVLFTENSHTIEQNSGIPLFWSFGEFATTAPLSYAYLINKLRKLGYKITNIDDLKFIVEGWKNEKNIPDDVKDILAKLEVAIKPYETIKIHDLAYMFPFNVTPAMLESKLQHMLSLKLQLWNKILNPQTIMMILALLMGGTICGVIAWKFLKQGDVSCTVKIVQAGIQTAQENITGIIG